VGIRRTVLAAAAAALGILPLAACGSDHAGAATAPTSVLATNATSANVFTPQDHGGSGGNPNDRLSGESHVTSLVAGTACPTLSFMMGSFKVLATGSTVFERGVCTDIAVGSKLRVSGTRQADGSILATSIEVEARENEHENEAVEGEDVITGLKAGTACPTLTFLIGTKSISVTASTVFEHGTCADLTVGTRVHVKGTMTGNSVIATRIEVQHDSPGHPEVEGEARVSSLVAGTACPALKFKIEEWTVTLGPSTVFTGGMCADIAVGKRLGVKGTVTGEHQVLATRIIFKGNGDN